MLKRGIHMLAAIVVHVMKFTLATLWTLSYGYFYLLLLLWLFLFRLPFLSSFCHQSERFDCDNLKKRYDCWHTNVWILSFMNQARDSRLFKWVLWSVNEFLCLLHKAPVTIENENKCQTGENKKNFPQMNECMRRPHLRRHQIARTKR